MYNIHVQYGVDIWDTPVSYTHLDVYKRQIMYQIVQQFGKFYFVCVHIKRIYAPQPSLRHQYY